MRIAKAVLEAFDNLLNPSDRYTHLLGNLTHGKPSVPEQDLAFLHPDLGDIFAGGDAQMHLKQLV